MPTFGTAEEPDFTLISGAELAEPPDGKVVCALRALNLNGGHGLLVFFLVIDDRNFILGTIRLACHLILVGVINLSDVTTFPAFELPPRRH